MKVGRVFCFCYWPWLLGGGPQLFFVFTPNTAEFDEKFDGVHIFSNGLVKGPHSWTW